jgi:ribosomal protein S3
MLVGATDGNAHMVADNWPNAMERGAVDRRAVSAATNDRLRRHAGGCLLSVCNRVVAVLGSIAEVA